MNTKLQLILIQFLLLEPPHGNEYHSYNLARNHLIGICRSHGVKNIEKIICMSKEDLRMYEDRALVDRPLNTERE